MGEVYRASDTKLGRNVAIKTLPSELAKDPDRLARFERISNLVGDSQCLGRRDRALREPVDERLAVDELHHDAGAALAALEPIDMSDVRVVK